MTFTTLLTWEWGSYNQLDLIWSWGLLRLPRPLRSRRRYVRFRRWSDDVANRGDYYTSC
jgi:hypothetical protein